MDDLYSMCYAVYQESEYIENEREAIVWNDGWYCSVEQEDLNPVIPLKVLALFAHAKACRDLSSKLDAFKSIIEEIKKRQKENEQKKERNWNMSLDKYQDQLYYNYF